MARLRFVQNVYGQRREISRRWPDGSIECPFCRGPIRPAKRQRCGNPACDACPTVTLAIADERRARYAAQAADEAERAKYAALRYR